MYTTYAIIDPRTRWIVYIGQTLDYARRQSDHLSVHRERKASPPGSLQHWLKTAHKAKIIPEFLALEVVETESESLKSETKWVEKIAGIGHPLLNRWEEHTPFIADLQPVPDTVFEAIAFRSETKKRRAERVGSAKPNRNRTGYRLAIDADVTLLGPITIDLVPPKPKKS
ncbi:MAG: hypothetical protein AAGL90_16850 [Pseudomonadota bacterium]